MKELSIEEKARAYDEAIRKAKITLGCCNSASIVTEHTIYDIFPELKESEDEKIRKTLIEYFNAYPKDYYGELKKSHILAWLEKQESVGEIVERCKKSWYNEGKIAGMAEGLTDDEKYQQGWHDALEKQGEQEPSWSEEDDEFLRRATNATKDAYPMTAKWLNSLKERYTWKPSDEQMADLYTMVCECRSADHQLLQDLYYGLKTLRGD